MPKNKAEKTLGRALIKAQQKKTQKKRNLYKAQKDTYGLEKESDEYVDYGGLDGTVSVTEQGNLDDFIAQANLANRKFMTERAATILLRDTGAVPEQQEDEDIHLKKAKLAKSLTFENLGIPRRPPWTADMSAEELDVQERAHFIEWRRQIAVLEEEHKDTYVTPFEKNLQFWRQLWRTMERSHVVCQIVDARNPLLFRCPDIDVYAKEIHPGKECVLIINKSDFLDDNARKIWGDYFVANGISYIFFSAKIAQANLDEEFEAQQIDQTKNDESVLRMAQAMAKQKVSDPMSFALAGDDDTPTADTPAFSSATTKTPGSGEKERIEDVIASGKLGKDPNRIYSRAELVAVLQEKAVQAFERMGGQQELDATSALGIGKKGKQGKERKARRIVPTIGMVGYPNVGKSSVINVVLGVSKTSHGAVRVAVASTPGKTKHFQTILLSDSLTLCDCPGLVFPTFMSSKAEMVCHGILPIDQMRDYIGPTSLLVSRVYPEVLEETYFLKLPRSSISGRILPLNAHSLLQTYSRKHGYFGSHHAGPDEPRGARYILKDYVNGKILYNVPPPGMDPMILMPKPMRAELPVSQRRQLLKSGAALVVGDIGDYEEVGEHDTKPSATREAGAGESGKEVSFDDFDEAELTLEEAAAILGEDDLELEEEQAIRNTLKKQSQRKANHKKIKKQLHKGRGSETPYADYENATNVYGGVNLHVAEKGLSNRKAKMMERHARKKQAGNGGKAVGAQLLG